MICDLSNFFEAHPKSRTIASLDAHNIALLTGYNLPADLVEFLQKEKLSAYQEDFFFTTLPQYHFQTLSEWGLDGKNCYAFLRTAFGSICYFHKGKIFQLDPFSGQVYKGRFAFCDFMNILVTMDAFLESTYFDIYKNIKKKQVLEPDEMYALAPALPLGGSFETSAFEVVKMREHLGLLAQLFGNKAKKT